MFSTATAQQGPIRQDGFESSFESASTPPLDSLNTINHPFLKFAANHDNIDFTDDLTGLISHERSTHSPAPTNTLSTSATSNSSTYQHNIFDISAPTQLSMHHNRDEFALQHREGTSPPENYSTGTRPDSAFPANFNSTLPALNSSMRYDPQPPPRFDPAAANRTGFDAGGRPFDRNSFDAARQDRVHTSPTFSDHRFDNRSFAADRFDSTGRPFDPRFDHFSESRRSDSFDQTGDGHHFGDAARFGDQEEHVNRFDPSHPGHHHALDKSWERHFTPSPDSPFAAGLAREAGRPTTASTNATSRSRSRSRPPSVGPQRTTRSRRNGSFSSAASGRIGRSDSISSLSGTSPTRPHAIVIPGKNQWGSLGSAGGLNGLNNGINGVGMGMGGYSASSPESAFSLPTPDSGFPHSFSSAYGAFAGSKDGLTTPTSSSLPSLTGLPSLGGSQYHAPAAAPQQATQNKLDEKRRRRRESHNAVERRRRDNINERISELAGLIPEEMLDGVAGQGGNAGDKAEKDKAGQSPTSPTSPMLDMLKMEDGDGAESLNAPGTVTPTPATANDSKDKPNSMKANKGMILRKSVEYIRYLQQLVNAQGARNRELEDELRGYRGNGNGNGNGQGYGSGFSNGSFGNFGNNGFETFNSGREFLTIQEEDIEMRDGERSKNEQAGNGPADDRPQDDRPRGGNGNDLTRGDSPLTAPSSSGGEEEDEDSDDEYVEGPKRARRRTGAKKGQKTPRAGDANKVNGAKGSPVLASALRRGRRGRSDETDEGMEE
ncbi:helix-loop-helix DNA-binding domain-containing protein [Schizophyllum commune]